jgi:hypothetical protein
MNAQRRPGTSRLATPFANHDHTDLKNLINQ